MITPTWYADAACAQTDPEIFFPDTGGTPAPAKAICATCPVQQECLEHALTTREAFGVWGGLTANERADLRRARAAA